MAKINETNRGVADRNFIDIIETFINLIINHLQKEFYITLFPDFRLGVPLFQSGYVFKSVAGNQKKIIFVNRRGIF